MINKKYLLNSLIFVSSLTAYPMLENSVAAITYAGKQAVGIYAVTAAVTFAHELLGHGATSILLFGPKSVKGLVYGGYLTNEDLLKTDPHGIYIKGMNPGAMMFLYSRPTAPDRLSKAKEFAVFAAGPAAGIVAAGYLISKLFPDNNKKLLVNLPIVSALATGMVVDYLNYFDLDPDLLNDAKTDGNRMADILEADRVRFNKSVACLGVAGLALYTKARFFSNAKS